MVRNPILAALTSALRGEAAQTEPPRKKRRRSSAAMRHLKPQRAPLRSKDYIPTAFLQNPIDDAAIEQKCAVDAAIWRDALRR
ncbi:MAG: hypothetical protein EOQ50_18440 [Mesorhizobium sp.]|uniref:hypothetical protein n=1 Tax=Mesorhizobium sp. TaxID=1871066 RepID=UPI000FE6AF71|nr:hypothetical protein [Mesorhizobium sp.]RWB72947.1 MAG: hypothetical protein EOQ50_18440 [Mesorhizobium sp.]